MDLSPFKQDIDELIDEFAQVYFYFLKLFFMIQFFFFKLKEEEEEEEEEEKCSNTFSFCESQGELTALADMKRVWLSRKFSYIYEASPSTNLSFFIQSLYAHTIRKL